jgi:bifunctional DNA-binding transcriptional regulator/antitoxin component of YhaV-PrlF toxin-antitoxin module
MGNKMAGAPTGKIQSEDGAASGSRGRVSATGRLSLPADLRRAVGLEKGGLVRIEVVDGAIRIKTMKDVRDRVRTLAQNSGLTDKASVEDFLSWRAGERRAETGGAGAVEE